MALLSAIFTLFLAGSLTAQDTEGGNPTGPSGEFNGESTTGGAYDPLTHNVKRRVTDLVVPGSNGAYPLAFSRTYNSKYTQVGGDALWFGNGNNWRHSYQWTLDATNPNAYTVAYPDGAVITFRPGRGSAPKTDFMWRGPAGTTDRLAGQSYSTQAFLYTSDGGVVAFDTQFGPGLYHPGTITDPYGAVTKLDYSSGNPNLLTQVTEPGGRWLKFGYSTATCSGTSANGKPTTVYFPYLSLVVASTQQSVAYDCQPLPGSANPPAYCVLMHATYNNETSTAGGHVQATYACASYNGTPSMPLLTTAVDPHYAGAMTNILYAYSSASGDIAGERNLQTGEYVTTFDSTNLVETRGDKGPGNAAITRGFKYGEPATNGFNPTNATAALATTRTDFDKNPSYVSYYGKADKDIHGQGYVAATKDRLGYVTQYDHEPITGKTTWMKLPDGRTRLWKWNLSQSQDNQYPYYLYQSTDERGQSTNYQRNSYGQVIEVDYPADGGKITYDYQSFACGTDINGNPRTFRKVRVVTDQRGAQTIYGYDEPNSGNIVHGGSGGLGLLTSVTRNYLDAGKALHTETTQLCYDPMDRLIRAISPLHAADQFFDEYTYNDRHQLTEVHHRADNTYVDYGYDDYGNRVWARDELNHITYTNYDSYRRVVSVVAPVDDSASTSRYVVYAYDRWDNGNARVGTPTSHTSAVPGVICQPSSKAVQRIFSSNGWLTDEYDGMTVDGNGVPHPGPGFVHTTFQYDANGQRTKVVDAQGCAWTSSYDNCGRLHTSSDPFDASGPGNHTVTWSYYAALEKDAGGMDSSGLVKTVTRPGPNPPQYAQVSTTYTRHDQMGRVKEVQDTYGHTYASAFSLAGDLTSQTDGIHGLGYQYDQLGRAASIPYPDGTTESWAYDADGKEITFTNRRGHMRTTKYDSRDQIKRTDWNTDTPYTKWTIDAAGRTTEVDNLYSQITLTYDNADELTSEQAVTQNLLLAPTRYRYDLDGNVDRITYPNGNYPSFTYDAQQRPTSMYSGPDNAPVTFSQYVYNNNQLTARWLYNGLYTQYGYQINGRVNDLWHHDANRRNASGNNANVRRHLYGYAPDGRVNWVDREADGGESGSALENGRGDVFTYFADGSLKKAARDQAPNPTWPGGPGNPSAGDSPATVNYTAGTGASATTYLDTYAYDQAGNRSAVTQFNPAQNITYGENGRGLNQYGGSNYYEGDATTDGNTTDSAVGWTYAYDDENHLTHASNPGTGEFLDCVYDGLGRLAGRNLNNVLTLFFYAGAQRIEEHDYNNGALRYLYFYDAPGSDQILFRQDNVNGRLWYQSDLMGNTTQLSGETPDTLGRRVVEQYLYDAYGLPTVYDGAGVARPSNASAYDNRYQWHGASAYEWLGSPKLYHARARYYLPQHGRWLQPDPIGQAGGLNLYAYCNDDPINGDDPSGMQSAAITGTADQQADAGGGSSSGPIFTGSHIPGNSIAASYIGINSGNYLYTGGSGGGAFSSDGNWFYPPDGPATGNSSRVVINGYSPIWIGGGFNLQSTNPSLIRSLSQTPYINSISFSSYITKSKDRKGNIINVLHNKLGADSDGAPSRYMNDPDWDPNTSMRQPDGSSYNALKVKYAVAPFKLRNSNGGPMHGREPATVINMAQGISDTEPVLDFGHEPGEVSVADVPSLGGRVISTANGPMVGGKDIPTTVVYWLGTD